MEQEKKNERTEVQTEDKLRSAEYTMGSPKREKHET
jgi:hypothetical protein